MDPVNQLCCPTCRRKTSTRLFRNHSRTHYFRHCDFNCAETIAEPYSCPCRYRDLFTSSMKNHLNEKHSVKLPEMSMNYGCKKCSFETYSILLYYKHYWKCASNLLQTKNLLEKTTIRRIESEICCYQSEWKTGQIERHTADSDANWFKCDKCDYKTKNNGDMKQHVVTKHTAVEDKWFRCDKCYHKTKTKNAMQKHVLRKHSDDKNAGWFTCDECDFKTKIKWSLKIHVLGKHTADEDATWFKCDKCNYKTKTKTQIKSHVIRKHTDDATRFTCDKCDYKTKLKCDMRNHVIRKHSDVKDANCLTCDKCDFTTKLKSYMRKHVTRKHTANV